MRVHDEGSHGESKRSAISKRCLAFAQGGAADVAAVLGKVELTKSPGVAGEKGDMVALAKAHEVAIRKITRASYNGSSSKPARLAPIRSPN